MKKLLLLFAVPALLVITSWTNSPQESTGITFFKGTFNEALKKAEAEGKLVFFDAYAVWCGPCKMMNKNTFPDATLGQYFNENYISLKMDMEKGEGPKIKAQYKVPGYPTMLFLDPTGKELNRLVGYRDANTLLGVGKKVVESNK